MTVKKDIKGNVMTLTPDGRLDTSTAPELEKALNKPGPEITLIVFDFAMVSYISSAGLRVLLTASKMMNGQGDVKVINANKTVLEVFEVTGFDGILNVG